MISRAENECDSNADPRQSERPGLSRSTGIARPPTGTWFDIRCSQCKPKPVALEKALAW